MTVKQWVAYGLVITAFVVFSQPVPALPYSERLHRIYVKQTLQERASEVEKILRSHSNEIDSAAETLQAHYLDQNSERSPFTIADFPGVRPELASLLTQVLNDQDEAVRNGSALDFQRTQEQFNQLMS